MKELVLFIESIIYKQKEFVFDLFPVSYIKLRNYSILSSRPFHKNSYDKKLSKNCRKCKTKIKKSFTKILTIILSVKIVLTLCVKLPCPKCKILIVKREILVLSFIVSEKNRKKDGRCIGAST